MREAKAGTHCKGLKKNCREKLLTGLLPLTFSTTFLTQPWPTSLGVASPTVEWAPLHHLAT